MLLPVFAIEVHVCLVFSYIAFLDCIYCLLRTNPKLTNIPSLIMFWNFIKVVIVFLKPISKRACLILYTGHSRLEFLLFALNLLQTSCGFTVLTLSVLNSLLKTRPLVPSVWSSWHQWLVMPQHDVSPVNVLPVLAPEQKFWWQTLQLWCLM